MPGGAGGSSPRGQHSHPETSKPTCGRARGAAITRARQRRREVDSVGGPLTSRGYGGTPGETTAGLSPNRLRLADQVVELTGTERADHRPDGRGRVDQGRALRVA
jgi:hypothetical protein